MKQQMTLEKFKEKIFILLELNDDIQDKKEECAEFITKYFNIEDSMRIINEYWGFTNFVENVYNRIILFEI